MPHALASLDQLEVPPLPGGLIPGHVPLRPPPEDPSGQAVEPVGQECRDRVQAWLSSSEPESTLEDISVDADARASPSDRGTVAHAPPVHLSSHGLVGAFQDSEFGPPGAPAIPSAATTSELGSRPGSSMVDAVPEAGPSSPDVLNLDGVMALLAGHVNAHCTVQQCHSLTALRM
jgi:hypothetical protein